MIRFLTGCLMYIPVSILGLYLGLSIPNNIILLAVAATTTTLYIRLVLDNE